MFYFTLCLLLTDCVKKGIIKVENAKNSENICRKSSVMLDYFRKKVCGGKFVRKILSLGEKIVSLGNAHIIKNRENDMFYLVIPFGSIEMSKVGNCLSNFIPRNRNGVEGHHTVVSERTVGDFLIQIGIPENVRGFYYLRTAVIYAVNENYHTNVSGHIYSVLTSEYNTTVSKIERSMRYALSVAFDRGDPSVLNEIFGSAYSSDTGRPRNLDAVYAISNAIKKRLNLV